MRERGRSHEDVSACVGDRIIRIVVIDLQLKVIQSSDRTCPRDPGGSKKPARLAQVTPDGWLSSASTLVMYSFLSFYLLSLSPFLFCYSL